MIVLAATAQAAGEDYTTIPEALVNTVIAMGTVFLVLILISFIISLLKYIPALMDKFTKKEEPVQPILQAQPAPAPKPVVQTPAAPADDTQLIAVITAAVAAAMEQDGVAVPADGLVIRSIKKRSY